MSNKKSKFKIGDKVRVIPCKDESEKSKRERHTFCYDYEMDNVEPFKISRMEPYCGNGPIAIRSEENDYTWAETWIEMVKPRKPLTYKKALKILLAANK